MLYKPVKDGFVNQRFKPRKVMDGLKKTFGKASQALTEKVGNADNLAGSTMITVVNFFYPKVRFC